MPIFKEALVKVWPRGGPFQHPRARMLFGKARTGWGSSAAIALAVWMAVAGFPAAPAPQGTDLDQSWVLALNLAHAQGLVAGKDIIWTYGPLGYLSSPSSASGGMVLPLIYRLGVYGLWAAALFRLRHRPWMVLTLGLAALLDPFVATDHLEVATYAVAVLVLTDRPGWRDAALWLLAFLAGVALLGKATLGLQATAMLACLIAIQFWRDRNWLRQVVAPVAVLAVTVTGLYWAWTGDPASLSLYVRNSLELISGYSESMSTPGEMWQVELALGAMATLLIGIPAAAGDRKRLIPVLPLAAACAFLVFKSSVVRQGAAHFVSYAPKLMLAALFLLAVAEAARSRRMLMGFQAACMVFAYWFGAQSWPEMQRQIGERLRLRQSILWMEVFLKWPETARNLDIESNGNLSALKVSAFYRAEIDGHTADSIPWDVAQIRANGWKWRPRPVFQSYAAYTPALDTADAEHLKSKAAADFLLVSWKAIDGRHPFLEEPLTWQERLNRYQTDLHDRELLLLKRRAEPRFPAAVEWGENSSRIIWGQTIAVPDDPRVKVRLTIEKSWFGSLRAALFRLNPLWMEVTRRSGRTERWRVVRGNLRNGIKIRELPADLEDVALLGQPGCAVRDPVTSFRLQTDHRAHYAGAITLQWGRRAEEDPLCMLLAETHSSFDVAGGPGVVKMLAGGDQKWDVKSQVPWVKAESDTAGVQFAVESNLSAESRRGDIAVSGLKFHIFQSGISSWSAVFHPVGSRGFFNLGGDETLIRTFGVAGDQPVAGDWTGSGVTRIGVFRQGGWFVDLNNNGKWDGVEGGDGFYGFGQPGDRAVVGDWNGDGVANIGVYRSGLWVLDFKGTHKFDTSSGGLRSFHFGLASDQPVVSNWRHNGRQDQAGVFREGMWYVDSNGDGKFDVKEDDLYPFGLTGDIPVVVDWGKYGGKKIGVYRRGLWVLDKNGDNRYDGGDVVFSSGRPGDVPLTGRWK